MCSVSQMAPTILCKSIRGHHANLEHEKTQIIKTALKLICRDIALIDIVQNSYPTSYNMTDIDSQLALVLASPQMFLRPIVKTDVNHKDIVVQKTLSCRTFVKTISNAVCDPTVHRRDC